MDPLPMTSDSLEIDLPANLSPLTLSVQKINEKNCVQVLNHFTLEDDRFYGKYVAHRKMLNGHNNGMMAEIQGIVLTDNSGCPANNKITCTCTFDSETSLSRLEASAVNRLVKVLDHSDPEYQMGGEQALLEGVEPILKHIFMHLLTLNPRLLKKVRCPDYDDSNHNSIRTTNQLVAAEQSYCGKFVSKRMDSAKVDLSVIETSIQGDFEISQRKGRNEIRVTYAYNPLTNSSASVGGSVVQLLQLLDTETTKYQESGEEALMNEIKPLLVQMFDYLLSLNPRMANRVGRLLNSDKPPISTRTSVGLDSIRYMVDTQSASDLICGTPYLDSLNTSPLNALNNTSKSSSLEPPTGRLESDSYSSKPCSERLLSLDIHARNSTNYATQSLSKGHTALVRYDNRNSISAEGFSNTIDRSREYPRNTKNRRCTKNAKNATYALETSLRAVRSAGCPVTAERTAEFTFPSGVTFNRSLATKEVLGLIKSALKTLSDASLVAPVVDFSDGSGGKPQEVSVEVAQRELSAALEQIRNSRRTPKQANVSIVQEVASSSYSRLCIRVPESRRNIASELLANPLEQNGEHEHEYRIALTTHEEGTNHGMRVKDLHTNRIRGTIDTIKPTAYTPNVSASPEQSERDKRCQVIISTPMFRVTVEAPSAETKDDDDKAFLSTRSSCDSQTPLQTHEIQAGLAAAIDSTEICAVGSEYSPVEYQPDSTAGGQSEYELLVKSASQQLVADVLESVETKWMHGFGPKEFFYEASSAELNGLRDVDFAIENSATPERESSNPVEKPTSYLLLSYSKMIVEKALTSAQRKAKTESLQREARSVDFPLENKTILKRGSIIGVEYPVADIKWSYSNIVVEMALTSAKRKLEIELLKENTTNADCSVEGKPMPGEEYDFPKKMVKMALNSAKRKLQFELLKEGMTDVDCSLEGKSIPDEEYDFQKKIVKLALNSAKRKLQIELLKEHRTDVDCLLEGKPIPGDESDVRRMVSEMTLPSATKRKLPLKNLPTNLAFEDTKMIIAGSYMKKLEITKLSGQSSAETRTTALEMRITPPKNSERFVETRRLDSDHPTDTTISRKNEVFMEGKSSEIGKVVDSATLQTEKKWEQPKSVGICYSGRHEEQSDPHCEELVALPDPAGSLGEVDMKVLTAFFQAAVESDCLLFGRTTNFRTDGGTLATKELDKDTNLFDNCQIPGPSQPIDALKTPLATDQERDSRDTSELEMRNTEANNLRAIHSCLELEEEIEEESKITESVAAATPVLSLYDSNNIPAIATKLTAKSASELDLTCSIVTVKGALDSTQKKLEIECLEEKQVLNIADEDTSDIGVIPFGSQSSLNTNTIDLDTPETPARCNDRITNVGTGTLEFRNPVSIVVSVDVQFTQLENPSKPREHETKNGNQELGGIIPVDKVNVASVFGQGPDAFQANAKDATLTDNTADREGVENVGEQQESLQFPAHTSPEDRKSCDLWFQHFQVSENLQLSTVPEQEVITSLPDLQTQSRSRQVSSPTAARKETERDPEFDGLKETANACETKPTGGQEELGHTEPAALLDSDDKSVFIGRPSHEGKGTAESEVGPCSTDTMAVKMFVAEVTANALSLLSEEMTYQQSVGSLDHDSASPIIVPSLKTMPHDLAEGLREPLTEDVKVESLLTPSQGFPSDTRYQEEIGGIAVEQQAIEEYETQTTENEPSISRLFEIEARSQSVTPDILEFSGKASPGLNIDVEIGIRDIKCMIETPEKKPLSDLLLLNVTVPGGAKASIMTQSKPSTPKKIRNPNSSRLKTRIPEVSNWHGGALNRDLEDISEIVLNDKSLPKPNAKSKQLKKPTINPIKRPRKFQKTSTPRLGEIEDPLLLLARVQAPISSKNSSSPRKGSRGFMFGNNNNNCFEKPYAKRACMKCVGPRALEITSVGTNNSNMGDTCFASPECRCSPERVKRFADFCRKLEACLQRKGLLGARVDPRSKHEVPDPLMGKWRRRRVTRRRTRSEQPRKQPLIFSPARDLFMPCAIVPQSKIIYPMPKPSRRCRNRPSKRVPTPNAGDKSFNDCLSPIIKPRLNRYKPIPKRRKKRLPGSRKQDSTVSHLNSLREDPTTSFGWRFDDAAATSCDESWTLKAGLATRGGRIDVGVNTIICAPPFQAVLSTVLTGCQAAVQEPPKTLERCCKSTHSADLCSKPGEAIITICSPTHPKRMVNFESALPRSADSEPHSIKETFFSFSIDRKAPHLCIDDSIATVEHVSNKEGFSHFGVQGQIFAKRSTESQKETKAIKSANSVSTYSKSGKISPVTLTGNPIIHKLPGVLTGKTDVTSLGQIQESPHAISSSTLKESENNPDPRRIDRLIAANDLLRDTSSTINEESKTNESWPSHTNDTLSVFSPSDGHVLSSRASILTIPSAPMPTTPPAQRVVSSIEPCSYQPATFSSNISARKSDSTLIGLDLISTFSMAGSSTARLISDTGFQMPSQTTGSEDFAQTTAGTISEFNTAPKSEVADLHGSLSVPTLSDEQKILVMSNPRVKAVKTQTQPEPHLKTSRTVPVSQQQVPVEPPLTGSVIIPQAVVLAERHSPPGRWSHPRLICTPPIQPPQPLGLRVTLAQPFYPSGVPLHHNQLPQAAQAVTGAPFCVENQRPPTPQIVLTPNSPTCSYSACSTAIKMQPYIPVFGQTSPRFMRFESSPTVHHSSSVFPPPPSPSQLGCGHFCGIRGSSGWIYQPGQLLKPMWPCPHPETQIPNQQKFPSGAPCPTVTASLNSRHLTPQMQQLECVTSASVSMADNMHPEDQMPDAYKPIVRQRTKRLSMDEGAEQFSPNGVVYHGCMPFESYCGRASPSYKFGRISPLSPIAKPLQMTGASFTIHGRSCNLAIRYRNNSSDDKEVDSE